MNSHSTIEGDPETSKPRHRPGDMLGGAPLLQRPPAMTPAIKRVSGEGAPLRQPTATPARAQEHAQDRQARMNKLLRHKLTSPEKRTVKRIQAQRVELFVDGDRPALDVVQARVLGMLKEDRGLRQGLDDAEAYETLARWLVDDKLATRTAAEVVGMFLREVGAMERPELSAPRVKAALRVLNEILYGADQSSTIPQSVREFRLEKRDGGLQIVGVLRAGADELSVRRACAKALPEHRDVDVRLISRK